MLSIAMLDRVKIFKEEKETAQKLVIENLEELTKYKEGVNQELEIRINEKTTELLAKKNEVNLAIILGEERERRRIAQELHDGLGSTLATLKLNAESLNLESKDLNATEWKAYHGLLELVDYACVSLRDISHNMLPAGIEHFGLEATLQSDIAKIKKHKGLQINFETFGIDTIQHKEIELHVYRIVLELLNNVIKHAQASQVNIQLMKHDATISLIVEDNGIGFNPEKTILSGIGIISVKSRVEALSGKMQIDSTKQKGTSITIEIAVP
jgi:signal transduction histidine kinase